MRASLRLICLLAVGFSLSGFTPGLLIRLYNETGEDITVAKDKSKRVTTILTGKTGEFSPVYLPGERLLIRSSKHTWVYSPRTLFPPTELYQQHGMIWRAFARIDRHGNIYMFAPPHDHGSPEEIAQPKGFPVKPQSKT